MDCMSCHSGEQKPHDEVTRFMYKQARQDGMETIYERFAKQQPQCGFGTLGVCCAPLHRRPLPDYPQGLPRGLRRGCRSDGGQESFA